MRAVAALVAKDLRSELRAPERLPTLALFGAAMLLALQFSLPPDAPYRPVAAAGFVWAAVVLAALLEVRRSFEAERREGTLDALRAAPIDPTLLLVAKGASALSVLVLLEAALVPLSVLFFGGRGGGILPAIGVTAAGSVGLVAWGTLFAAATGEARSGEVVLAVLLFPLLAPQTIAVVRLVASFTAGAPADVGTGLVLLGAFDVLSVGTSVLLFDDVIAE